ncbi:hypothetical protein HDC34_000804 [Pseudoclavibacter sp. JAI123]|uniref:hypothetical protein n=1 Tax=Pseudoclavibacter sp. JAI123 TaxID=2723065 RepID=UPI0015C6CE17|nr:hypothetical protein [Pseudoclavibacter sp. JAI123]NYF12510.1 hypothetical protein [Pseudoclavibacter sp. JAI123]
MPSTPRGPRIAIISAVPTAIAPANAALAARIPGAQLWNILDDRLLEDAADAGDLTPALRARMGALIDHALAGGADGVLLTCSLYGAVARSRASTETIAILAPDDAAFDAILAEGFGSILVVSPKPSALEDTLSRITAAAGNAAPTSTSTPMLVGIVAEGAHLAANAGPEALADTISAAIAGARAPFDAVLLAQYSLAPAAPLLSERLDVPLFSTPGSAADLLASRLHEAEQPA